MDIWVIDFEASGLSKKSYPIEAGITNGAVHYTALIKPMSHWRYWEAEAEKVHNIAHDEIMKNGETLYLWQMNLTIFSGMVFG